MEAQLLFIIAVGVLIPFVGTASGAGTVFFVRNELSPSANKALNGFAGGVMMAASIWSLIIPSMNMSENMGKFAFIPSLIGFWLGILFLWILDKTIPHLHSMAEQAEGPSSRLHRTTMLVLAVVLHNIPEGMAVGVLFAAILEGTEGITLASAFALSIGIALQNFPEGAIISLPLKAEGLSKAKSFYYGVLSGLVEVVASLITIFMHSIVAALLPYLLSFAAGAMVYVIVEDLIPETAIGEHSNLGVMFFSFGFTLMMVLDVALS